MFNSYETRHASALYETNGFRHWSEISNLCWSHLYWATCYIKCNTTIEAECRDVLGHVLGLVAGCKEEEGTDLPGTHREPSPRTRGAPN